MFLQKNTVNSRGIHVVAINSFKIHLKSVYSIQFVSKYYYTSVHI